MSDIASLGRYAHAALGNLPAVCLVGDGVALGVNLLQGMVYCIVYLQLEDEDVLPCPYHHIGSAKDAPHLGVDSGVKHGERHVEQELIERLTALLVVPFLLGDNVVGNFGYV